MWFPRVAVGAAFVLWAAGARAQDAADAVDIRCDGRAGLTVTRALSDASPADVAPPGSSVEAMSVQGPSAVRVLVRCGARATGRQATRAASRASPAAQRVHMAPLRKAGLLLGIVSGAAASLFIALGLIDILRQECDPGSTGATCHPPTRYSVAHPMVISGAVMVAVSAAGFLMLALGERFPAPPTPRVTLWVAPGAGGASAGFGLRF